MNNIESQLEALRLEELKLEIIQAGDKELADWTAKQLELARQYALNRLRLGKSAPDEIQKFFKSLTA